MTRKRKKRIKKLKRKKSKKNKKRIQKLKRKIKKLKRKKRTKKTKKTKDSKSNELIFRVPKKWSQSAYINKSQYEKKYKLSIKDNEGFWKKEGQRIDWIKPYTKTKDAKYSKTDVRIKWYYDGTLNASVNCIDRHLENKKNKTAIIWIGDDPKDSKKISYKELHENVCKAANGLKELGIKKGDRVTIYLTICSFAHIFMKFFIADLLRIFWIVTNPNNCSFIFFVF